MDKYLMHTPLCWLRLELPHLLWDIFECFYEHLTAVAVEFDLGFAFRFVHIVSLPTCLLVYLFLLYPSGPSQASHPVHGCRQADAPVQLSTRGSPAPRAPGAWRRCVPGRGLR